MNHENAYLHAVPGPSDIESDADRVRDPLAWTWVKHAAVAIVAAAALCIAFAADSAPLMAVGYAVTAVFGMALVAVADRTRFIAAWGEPTEIPLVDIVPEMQLAAAPLPAAYMNGVGPYAQMPAADPSFRLNVT
jgi:hypothetical protein